MTTYLLTRLVEPTGQSDVDQRVGGSTLLTESLIVVFILIMFPAIYSLNSENPICGKLWNPSISSRSS